MALRGEIAKEVPEDGLPAGYTGKGWHLHARVLPMGFLNLVAIAQHVCYVVVHQALCGFRAPWDQAIKKSDETDLTVEQQGCFEYTLITLMSCEKVTRLWQDD